MHKINSKGEVFEGLKIMVEEFTYTTSFSFNSFHSEH